MIANTTSLEHYFAAFAQHIIGNDQWFESPYGQKKIIYADWTASGRAYQPLEDCIQKSILPYAANTHTETNITGTRMSEAYHQAKTTIKQHVNANTDDVLVFCGSGMTHAVNKLQRILGLRMPERLHEYGIVYQPETAATLLRPVVFVTHMEHHSNHTSWLETIAEVVIINADASGNADLLHLKQLLEHFRDRKYKIAAGTACSNVTGMHTPYHAIAEMMHAHDGWCFVDFACSAPYVPIDMHPPAPGAYLDAIYFSGHKFLGGPGTPGILVFNSKLYNNQIPDQPGGGTVLYSNPWRKHCFINDIEEREDGGTPPVIGAIRAAMCIQLKELMGMDKIAARDKELVELVYARMGAMNTITLLEERNSNRLPIFSFVVEDAHHHLFVQLLNDRFGIQSRGGCSCAGTYGHYLLGVDKKESHSILQALRKGRQRSKPGWVRISLHPAMSNTVVNEIMDAVEETIRHYGKWAGDYCYDAVSNQYRYKGKILAADRTINKQHDSSVKGFFYFG